MKRLILLGGGHAHVKVLAELEKQPLPGWDVRLVSPHRRQIYSGMLPGWIAGHYELDACAIALDALAERATAGVHPTAGVGVDLVHNTLACADGSQLHFDLLSIDTGPAPAAPPGSAEHALPIRPIEGFVAAWPGLVARLERHAGPFELVVLGAGAAGVEIAFAVRQLARRRGWDGLSITLLGLDAWPLDGASTGARRRAARLLAQRGIAWQGERRVARVERAALVFDDGQHRRFDACIVSTGAAAPRWPADSGLATDDQGFIRVDATLRSVSHPQVLAAGDIAAYHESRPKSGVYAVRAGPVLAANLRALCQGQAPTPWQPPPRALSLVSTGDGHALAVWGDLSASGRWVWHWKDWIDRRFVRRLGTVAQARA